MYIYIYIYFLSRVLRLGQVRQGGERHEGHLRGGGRAWRKKLLTNENKKVLEIMN